MVKLAQHSEGRSSVSEVNHGVVHRNNVLLPGEVSVGRLDGFKSATKVRASAAAMSQAVQTEKSAEGIVGVTESVSSCVSMVQGEECGKPVRSKAQSEEEETTGGDL